MPCRDSQLRARIRKRGLHSIWCENRWGFSPPGTEESLLETQMPPSQGGALILYSTSRGSALPGPHLLVPPFCCARVLHRGLLAAPCRDLLGDLFLEKHLVKTQTVNELCSFGKGTILPQLQQTASSLSPVESLSLPYHSVACPSEFSHAGGNRVPCRTGTFRVLSSRESFVWESDRWASAGLCGYIMAQGVTFSPLQAQRMLYLEGEEVPAPSYRLVSTTPSKGLLGSSPPSPSGPTLLRSVLR